MLIFDICMFKNNYNIARDPGAHLSDCMLLKSIAALFHMTGLGSLCIQQALTIGDDIVSLGECLSLSWQCDLSLFDHRLG